MLLDDRFHGLSTRVETFHEKGCEKGSGFFYHQKGPPNPEKPEWVSISNTFLVTNRHLLLPQVENEEIIPNKIKFYHRRILKSSISWIPIEIDRKEFLKRAKFHPNPGIDVATVEILDLDKDLIKKSPVNESTHSTTIMNDFSVSKEDLPGHNNINVEVADDVVILGYPDEYYDTHNVFPIVKGGIIASRWGSNFNGLPYFLVDAKLFPGSSGSIVLSKPKDIAVINGQIFVAKEKQFAFLGIYASEPIVEINKPDDSVQIEKRFNLVVVWYGHLIEEIINNGIRLQE